jgi:2-amino-4-hydroxy-6-hydroxymethyldihydropteridine diphosphokinase|tara:strand:- start:563 stop:1075 length:513 start_codon:yes stop_codon:yes gene_type:complete
MIYLNIGSNLNSQFGDRFNNINKAASLLLSEKILIKKISNFYETPSYPNKSLPKYLNICLEIECNLDPISLLKTISFIENKIGRTKAIKNASRVCDIDIIDFKRKIINTDRLILPHPRSHLRNFVLYPLFEINPDWSHPLLNKKISVLIEELITNQRIEITRLNKSAILE